MYIIDHIVKTVFSSTLFLLMLSCANQDLESAPSVVVESDYDVSAIIPAAERMQLYYPYLDGKKVGLVVNQTSMIEDKHIVDSLSVMNVDITAIFSPEHGFRGEADAGEQVIDGKDARTGAPIYSLYGNNKKPMKEQLDGIEVMVFDIQDVGVRFYTYISTLHYVMEACAEADIPIIVLDRPNPNAHYIDGPVLESELKSFVGMHPVPIVYGMTIGEYAQMINGENWLKDGIKADLTVIPLGNYDHEKFYHIPIKPSPNLPNDLSIHLYPSLCLFEGTTVSIGRGTNLQFQLIGHPDYAIGSYTFTPESGAGAKYPKHEDKTCYGSNLQGITIGSLRENGSLNLDYLLGYADYFKKSNLMFFNKNNFFDKLAGTYDLRKQVEKGMSSEDIKATWQPKLEEFKTIRSKYLLYP